MSARGSMKLGPLSSVSQLCERVRELEQERQKLQTALKDERLRTEQERRRADLLSEQSRAAWRIAASGKRPETP